MDTCLIFNFSSVPALKDFSFFDIGKGKPYFNKIAATKGFNSLTEQLEAILLKTAEGVKVNLCFSGSFIEVLKETNELLLNKVQEAVSQKKIKLVGSTFHNSISSLFSDDIFEWELQAYKKLVKKHFSVDPRVFINTEGIYHNRLASFVKNAGYEIIVTEGLPWYLGDNHPYQLFNSSDKSVKVLLNTDIGDNTEKGYRAVSLYPSQDSLDLVKKITDLSYSNNLILAEDLITTDASHNYRIPMPVGRKDAGNYGYFVENTMQRDIIEKLKFLLQRARLQEMDIINELARFTAVDYFKAMNYKSNALSGQPYDYYISFMNILTDYELRKF